MSIQEQTARGIVETVSDARVWLGELSEPVVRERPTPDRWSIAEVIGHMIDSACNNHQIYSSANSRFANVPQVRAARLG